LITTIRNFLYDEKILPIRKVPDVEVICIGNVSVGGTGKTPAVHFFVKKLLAKGRKVAVVSRGYRGKRKRDPLLVSDGMVIFATAQESGDESYLHALNLKVPVIVGADRYKACMFAKKHFDIDTVVLDDGFQHRKLYRDRDVVLIDATNPFGGGNVLPAGLLREDFRRAVRRAYEFIITKSDLVNERELRRIKNYLRKKFKKEVSVAKHGISCLCDLKGNMKPLFWVKGKKVLIFSGLANPLNFEKTVISLAPSYIERIDFKDHHNFKAKDIALVKKKAENSYLYSTTDLATLKYRKDILNIDRAVYVAVEKQKEHFRQVFRIAEMIGKPYDYQKVHVWFGTMRFEDDIITEKGKTVGLINILEQAVEETKKIIDIKNVELTEKEKDEIAEIVGIGAVKYFDLSQNRMTSISFSWDKVLNFEGNTSPYLQYTYVRIMSVFRKLKENNANYDKNYRLVSEELNEGEKALAGILLKFPYAVMKACEGYKPNLIADYLFETAKIFNNFYASESIVREQDKKKFNTKLLLAEKTAYIIKEGLSLLGIKVVERM